MKQVYKGLTPLAIVALLAGCGGGKSSEKLSFETTRSCFVSKGYRTHERTDLGTLRPTYAYDWYTVREHGVDWLAVAFFKTADRASEARRQMIDVAKAYAKNAGVPLPDRTLDAVIRTRANALYWWKTNTPIREADVNRCLLTGANQ